MSQIGTSAANSVTISNLSSCNKHCVFRSGDAWFSIPAVSVREITVSPALVRVPGCHPSLAGICHLRSEFIPVISLSNLLGLHSEPGMQLNRKLMVVDGSSIWAFRIAEAAALETLETIVTPDGRSDNSNQSPVMGTAMSQGQIVSVLDPKLVFRLAQQTLEDIWSRPELESSTHSLAGSRS